MNLNYNKILIFDFETNGLNPISNNIIEIGAILLEKKNNTYEIKSELNLFIKQDNPLPSKIVEITNITDEIINEFGVSEDQAFHEFDNLIDDNTLLVAYNLAFDINFLSSLYQKHVNINYLMPNDILDVMAIYKDRYSFPHRLESALTTFNIVNERAHRAIDDAKSTYLLLDKLTVEKDNISKYINVLGYNPRYGIPKVRGLKQNINFIAQGMRGQGEIDKKIT